MSASLQPELIPPADSLDQSLARVLTRSGRLATTFVASHSRSITTAAVVAMVGFAATAFGIAPMAPDAADLPTQIVSEFVATDDIASQLEALAAHGVSLYRSETTRSGDTVDSLLKRLNIVDAEAAAFLREDAVSRTLFTGRSGKMIQARTDGNGHLEQLVARFAPDDSELLGSHFNRFELNRDLCHGRPRLQLVDQARHVAYPPAAGQRHDSALVVRCCR